MGSAKRDLLSFPARVVRAMGYDLSAIQYGEQDASGTYRAVYTIRFAKAIYVLHAFQKKSPTGIRTSRKDIALIGQRLRAAKQDYEARYGKEED
jgi:phage-related protein